MKRLRIGLDIDGVIYAWDKTARYMMREVLPNSPYKDDPRFREDSPSWNWIQDNVDPKHWDWLWSEGVRLGLFKHGHLFPGAIVGIRELATLGDIVLITHRPAQAVGSTLSWLALQDLPLSGLHILSNGENKGTVRPKVDYFLDDKPENVLDMHNAGVHSYLMRRPWNQDFMWTAVTNIREYAELIRKREEYEDALLLHKVGG